MVVTGYARFKWLPDKGVAWIKPLDADRLLYDRLAERKVGREEKGSREILLKVTLDLEYEKRTFKQNSTVWKLVTVIFETQEGRKPAEDEKYDLYLDLLEAFADKVPSKLQPDRLRAVHISESNTFQGARFIQGMMDWLAETIDMPEYLQATVRDVFWEWSMWRGTLEKDPLDYEDTAMVQNSTETEWWKRHKVSDASGVGGILHRAHIVSRGSDHAHIEEPWNWLALSPAEHGDQHQYGWDKFLAEFPHLRGRVERARELAGKLPLEMKGGFRG